MQPQLERRQGGDRASAADMLTCCKGEDNGAHGAVDKDRKVSGQSRVGAREGWRDGMESEEWVGACFYV